MNDVSKIIKINYYIIVIIIIVIIDILSLFLLFIFNQNKQNHSVVDLINMNLFSDTALNYLELPEKEVMLTLKTMYEEDLILPLVDSKNNECNELASYVKISKKDEKYKVDSVLICGLNTYNYTHYVRGR